jgi:RNA polymerase sigma-70 factor (ECF subfamily)
MVTLRGWIAVGENEGESAAESMLLRAGLAGDRAALEQLLGPHKRTLIALCYGILGNPDDAEDAAQETCLRALRALSRFRGDASFRTWLCRIALHVCLNWKRDRRPTEPLDEMRTRPARAADSPEAIVLRQLEVAEALDALRPQYRAVLLLKEWEGWSVAEIGATLRWNEKRVENALYRARRALVEEGRRKAKEGGAE